MRPEPRPPIMDGKENVGEGELAQHLTLFAQARTVAFLPFTCSHARAAQQRAIEGGRRAGEGDGEEAEEVRRRGKQEEEAEEERFLGRRTKKVVDLVGCLLSSRRSGSSNRWGGMCGHAVCFHPAMPRMVADPVPVLFGVCFDLALRPFSLHVLLRLLYL